MSYSDDDGSQVDSLRIALQDRIMRPLPKRARLAYHQASPSQRTTGLQDDVPALDPSSTSSTTDETPCTPPALQHYQPLFASVDQLVKQVAAATTLFGGADRSSTGHKPTSLPDHDTSDYDSYDEHPLPRSAPSKSHARTPLRNRSSHPQPLQLPDDTDGDAPSGSNKKKRKIPAALYAAAPSQQELPQRHLSTDEESFEESRQENQERASPLKDKLLPQKASQKDSKAPKRSRSAMPSISPSSSPRRFRRIPPPPPDSPWSDASSATSKSSSNNGPPARKTLKSKTTASDLSAPSDVANTAPLKKPPIVLNNLWQPSLGPLYMGSGIVPRGPSKSHFISPHEPALPAASFGFHVPLPSVLLTRVEDANRERERLQLARELVKEREREMELTKKRAELEEAVRKNEQALAELKPKVSVGIQADGDAAGGRELFASRWSTKEASQPLQRPPRKQPTAAPIAPSDADKKPPPTKGKKKRSAYANANNAHHRDNYVPSRAPRHGSNLPPPSLDIFPSLGLVGIENGFSTANYHPQLGYSNLFPFFASPDEWVCSWCEGDLLFGDAERFQKSIKKRAHVLKIRKRAQKRAARAASGQALTKAQQKQKAKEKASKSQPASAAAPSDRKNATTQTVPFEEMHVVAPPPVTPALEAHEAEDEDESDSGDEDEEYVESEEGEDGESEGSREGHQDQEADEQ